MESQPHNTVNVFCSYAHEDEALRQELEKHLKVYEREGWMTVWHDRKICAGGKWEGVIDEQLNAADVILLLVSHNFMDSDYCYDVEMQRALERQEAGDACVIPVLLRAVNWRASKFGCLQPLPADERAVTSWPNQDEALAHVAEGITKRLEGFTKVRSGESAKVVEGEKIDDSFPPPIAGPTPDSFVNRQDADHPDLAEYLMKELTPSRNKLMTLCGHGGVGKTTLASEVARRWKETYGGRVVWSDAGPRPDYSLSTLLDDIARQLGHQELVWSLPGAKKKRVHELVAAEHTLIVLDTYEAIAPDEQRRIKGWFRPPSWPALFVSREEIGEIPYIWLDPMQWGEAQEFLEGLIKQKSESDRQIFSDEIRERIIKTAERAPLLMEWLVGQIDEGEVPAEVFRDLKQGKGSAAERVFDRSFNLPQLGDDGRAALLALSLFKPSATREELALVAGFPGDKERRKKAIGNLRRLKLIKGVDQNRSLRIEGLTLSMAAARLPTSRYAAGIWQRFLTYLKEDVLKPLRDNPDADGAGRSKILRAMQVAPCMKDWDTVVELYDAQLDFTPAFDIHFYKAWQEAIELSEADAEQRMEVKTRPLPIIIEIYHRDKAGVREHYEGIQRKLCEDTLRKKVVLSGVKFELGVFAYERGERQLARELLEKAEELKREFHDLFGAAIACNNLGVVIATEGRDGWAAEARHKFEQALATFTKYGSPRGHRSLFIRWLLAMKDVLLGVLSAFKRSGSPKKGARFAKAVNRNLKWLARLERQRARANPVRAVTS